MLSCKARKNARQAKENWRIPGVGSEARSEWNSNPKTDIKICKRRLGNIENETQALRRGLNLQTELSVRAQLSVERGEAEFTKVVRLRTAEDIHAWLSCKNLNATLELIEKRLQQVVADWSIGDTLAQKAFSVYFYLFNFIFLAFFSEEKINLTHSMCTSWPCTVA